MRKRFALLQRGTSGDGSEIWLNWAVRLKASGDIIGRVEATVFTASGHCNVAWIIGRPWQGQGFAGEAARAMVAWLVDRGVSDLVANVADGHLASEDVARTIGLQVTDENHDGERKWVRLQ